MKIDNGGPAFPEVAYKEPIGGGAHMMTIHGGMTLRDYFAAKAMQAIQSTPEHITESDGSDAPDPLTDEDIARLSYELADAMLKARGE